MLKFIPLRPEDDPGADISKAAAVEIFEMKFQVPRQSRQHVLSLLYHRAQVPERFHHARMRTLYFDDRQNTSFLDGQDGNLYKKKFRLRQYLPPVQGALYSLEIKARLGNRTLKTRELIFDSLPKGYEFSTFSSLITEFEKLTAGGKSFAGLRAESSGHELYPDTEIYYERYRFVCPAGRTRYNLDINTRVTAGLIRAGISPAIEAGAIALNHDIFEIKGPEPEALPAFLKGLGIEPISLSKFVWGKDLAMQL